MASSTVSCSNSNPKSIQRNHNSPLERRPRLLKDFLYDDSNSCSSSGFKSFPRKSTQINSSILRENLNYGPKLQRSRSKAASIPISAFQAMINAVKSIHFVSSVKSPSILLPRSLSRKLSKRNSQSQLNVENKVIVTVKDIIRWKSFRDLVEEKSSPSDFASSSPPHHCTTTTTTTTTTTGSNTPCSSNGSSWCDSDFTSSEYSLSDEYGENEVDSKKFLPSVGKDPMETTTKTRANTDKGPKYEAEEREQHSPQSVHDSEDEEELEREMVKLVKAWIDEEHNEMIKRGVVDKTEACVKDMEREGKWREGEFNEEQEELVMGVERWVMNILVNELLVDLLVTALDPKLWVAI